MTTLPPMPSWVHSVQQDYSNLMKKVKEAAPTLNPGAALMLARIGTNTLTPGEIKEHAYHGTNASYNLNALFKRGYILSQEVERDRRQKLIFLTPKGLKTAAAVRNALSEARIREVA